MNAWRQSEMVRVVDGITSGNFARLKRRTPLTNARAMADEKPGEITSAKLE